MARPLSEPSLLLKTSRCLYCSFTMFPLCIYSFPARLLKHPHATASPAQCLLGKALALARFLTRPPSSMLTQLLLALLTPDHRATPLSAPCLAAYCHGRRVETGHFLGLPIATIRRLRHGKEPVGPTHSEHLDFPPLPRRHRLRVGPQSFLPLSSFLL
jgi:hypothetical protein